MKNTQTFKLKILPTKKATNLYTNLTDVFGNKCKCKLEITENETFKKNALLFNSGNAASNSGSTYQFYEIYIISDEEPKNNEWCVGNKGSVLKVPKLWISSGDWKKIIATTDKSLNLPLIHDSFLPPFIKAYNEGKAITEVDLEMCGGTNDRFIQKEWRIKTRPDNTVIIHESKKYSKEEVVKLLNGMAEYITNEVLADDYMPTIEDTNKWIDKNL